MMYPRHSELGAYAPPHTISSTFPIALCGRHRTLLSLAELTGSEARAQSTRFRTLTVPTRFAIAMRKATPPAFDMWKGVNWTADPP